MTIHLTDDEVALLYCHAEGERKARWEAELRDRTRWALVDRLPSRRGTCAAGRRVVIDDKGAMSSGYILHAEDFSTCDHQPVTWDEPTPQEAFTRALIETLR